MRRISVAFDLSIGSSCLLHRSIGEERGHAHPRPHRDLPGFRPRHPVSSGNPCHTQGTSACNGHTAYPARHRRSAIGRYLLDASIFEYLATQKPGAGGEVELTDAIARGVRQIGLTGFQFTEGASIAGPKRASFAQHFILPQKIPNSQRCSRSKGSSNHPPA